MSTVDRDEVWLDDAAGPVVRPYTLTGGRTRPVQNFDLVAYVMTVEPSPPRNPRLTPEHRIALDICRQPMSVAEVASRMALPIGVVRVLLSDLLEEQLIMVREPAYEMILPDEYLLEAVLNGLKAL